MRRDFAEQTVREKKDKHEMREIQSVKKKNEELREDAEKVRKKNKKDDDLRKHSERRCKEEEKGDETCRKKKPKQGGQN